MAFETKPGTIQQLPTRVQSNWTPRQVKSALSGADSGNLMSVADLVESVNNDDRVSGVLSTLTNGMLGLPLSFIGDDEVTDALKGDDDSKGDWWSMFPESELSKLMRWGITLGVGIGQRVPVIKRQLGEREVLTLKTWHPRWLRRQLATANEPGKWLLTTAAGQIEIEPGDGQWIIYCPYGGDRPWAEGKWRALSFAWILKQFALHDRARHSEVLGSPARVGVSPEGATTRGRQNWLKQLKAMGRDTSLILPPGYNLKLVEATGRTWEIYTKQIEWADSATAVVLAGQTVTTEGSSGFSRGNIHERIAHSIIRFGAETLSTTVRQEGLMPWSSENFGASQRAPWPVWDTTPPEDQKQKAETGRILGDAISKMDEALAASKRRVDATAILEAAGVPTLEIETTGDQAPSVELAPTDVAKVVRVNEARASAGLGPLLLPGGEPDPDGDLTVAEFAAKKALVVAPPPAAPPAPVPSPRPGGLSQPEVPA